MNDEPFPADPLGYQRWLDRFIDDRIALAGAFVLLVIGWTLAARLFGYDQKVFRRTTWAIDAILLPPTITVAGSLARIAAEGIGASFLDPYLRSLALFLVYVTYGGLAASGIDLFFLRSDDARRRYGTAILRNLLYVIGVTCGIAIFMVQEGYDITGLLVSTGVAAAGAAFALQQTLRDWLSGIALSIERPVAVGDWIELEDGTLGQVLDITWRAAWLKSWNNTLLIVPNGKLASVRIQNYNRPTEPYAPWYMIKLPVELEPTYAVTLIREAALRCETVMRSPAPVVRLMDATTVPYTYMVWVHFENYPAMFRGREELFREVDRGLRTIGITPSATISEFHARQVEAPVVAAPTVQETLQASPAFKSLTPEALKQLTKNSGLISYEAGDTVIEEGSDVSVSYVVVSGRFEGYTTTSTGAELVTERFISGDAFGFTMMLTNQPAFISVRAVTGGMVIRLSTDCLRDVLPEMPEFRDHLADLINQRMRHRDEARQMAAGQAPRTLSLREIRRRLDRALGLAAEQ